MSTPAPKGSDSPIWMRRGDDSARSWGREKEPGVAFRGITRGRGRGGGAGRGRPGGRGGGGRSLSTRGTSDLKPTPSPVPEKAGISGEAVTNNNAQSKGRGAPKAPVRPPLAVDLLVSQSPDSIPPLSPNKPTRRRRNTHKRSVSAALPKPLATTIADGFPTSPSTPLMPSSKDPKDPPPHIGSTTDSDAPVHDLRQDIHSLVEHVRSMAMDGNRPSSPSTHIDWAGDDDDSLPDLDDWGVSSKLASEVGEPPANVETKTISVTMTPPNPVIASIPKKVESVEHANAQALAADGTQSSAESPTESSTSLSVPPPVKRERERRRERGSRREKERRTSLALKVNGSKGAHVPLTAMPKKSLLERLSSPVRPEPPALPQEPDLAPSPGANQAIVESTSGSTLPRHPSLPPKPSSVPTKPPLSTKAVGSWREAQPESSLAKESSIPTPNAKPTASKVANEGALDVSEKASITPLPTELKKDTDATGNKSSFDWSEEPVSFDTPLDSSKRPSVDVEPATPLDNSAAQALPANVSLLPLVPAGANAKSDADESPRFRSQRPLSSDVTPRPRRERSPYKTHNPRNHSAPHAGPVPGPAARTRPQHVSRPIIRMDALAMISRSLRDSPPRRESPPTTKAGE